MIASFSLARRPAVAPLASFVGQWRARAKAEKICNVDGDGGGGDDEKRATGSVMSDEQQRANTSARARALTFATFSAHQKRRQASKRKNSNAHALVGKQSRKNLCKSAVVLVIKPHLFEAQKSSARSFFLCSLCKSKTPQKSGIARSQTIVSFCSLFLERVVNFLSNTLLICSLLQSVRVKVF